MQNSKLGCEWRIVAQDLSPLTEIYINKKRYEIEKIYIVKNIILSNI